MKKTIALILALAMMFALCACTFGGTGSTGEATLDPLTKDDVVKVVVNSHPSWPFNNDWKVWEYIREGTGATVEVQAIPSSDFDTKISLMFTGTDTLPDVVQTMSKSKASSAYAKQGALVSFEQVKQYMPDTEKFFEGLTDDKYSNLVTLNREVDGNLYWFAYSGRESSQSIVTWLYRKDIFDKHGLEVPTTFDELYEVCKKLKELYPESYPFSMRAGASFLGVTAPSFDRYWDRAVYYDYEDKEWRFGPMEETLLEVIKYHKKMVDEGLLMKDYWTISTSSWEELVTTDRGFIFPDYHTRIDFFNSLARPNNPDFNLTAMTPPIANEEKGAHEVRGVLDAYGYMLPNTRDERRIANAAKYLNWFYTDEAVELVSWGKEGETYEVVDGKKQYITDENGTQPITLYGFNSNGAGLRMDPEAIAALESEDMAAVRPIILDSLEEGLNPASRLSFTDEESTRVQDIDTAIGSYCREWTMKFILGQEPLSKWDEYLAGYDAEAINEMLEIYDTAHKRIAE